MPDQTKFFWESLLQIADAWAPAYKKAFLAGLARARARLSPAAIVKLLDRGRIDEAVKLILGPVDQAQYFWSELVQLSREAVISAGLKTVADMKLELRSGGKRSGIFVQFDQLTPQVAQAMRQAEMLLVREIDEATRRGLKVYIRAAMDEGKNPRSLIPELAGRVQTDGVRRGGVLGLTERQAKAVQNFRRMLEEGEYNEALGRMLRDLRYDSKLRNAVGGRSLSQEEIDKMVARYESNYLAYRAEVVARTESLRALRLGQQLGWEDTVARGLVPAASIQRRWVTAGDGRVRLTHQQMNGMVVGLNQPFVMPGGRATMLPDEPNCRCIIWTRPLVQRVI